MNKDNKLLAEAYEKVFEAQQATMDPFKDFAEEFKWYQDQGLFKKDIDIQKLFNQGQVKESAPGSLDSVSNCYTKLINAKNEEERFEQFVKLYLAEDREGTDRADSAEGKKDYLRKLIETVKTNKSLNPSVVITVEGVGGLMVGGRTRAAAAKVANVAIKVKFIPIPSELIQDLDKVKQIFNSLKV